MPCDFRSGQTLIHGLVTSKRQIIDRKKRTTAKAVVRSNKLFPCCLSISQNQRALAPNWEETVPRVPVVLCRKLM